MGSDKKFKEFLWLPSVALIRAIIGYLCFQWGMLMVDGLKLENVSVPPSGIIGGSVTLGCDYLLESDALLSLKWYRDGHEFFRYSPGNKDSPIVTFHLPGVHVDLGESMTVQRERVKFRLKNLDLNSEGMYRCEILADTTFRTLYSEGNLSIMALPENPKVRLTGFPSTVHQYGEKIYGNCTFANTYPSAELTLYLYLNNTKMNTSDDMEVIRYDPIKVAQNRLTSIVGLKFRAAHKHFQDGILQIRCDARLFDQKWENVKNITHLNYQPPFLTAGQNRYSSASDGGSALATGIMAVMVAKIPMCYTFWNLNAKLL